VEAGVLVHAARPRTTLTRWKIILDWHQSDSTREPWCLYDRFALQVNLWISQTGWEGRTRGRRTDPRPAAKRPRPVASNPGSWADLRHRSSTYQFICAHSICMRTTLSHLVLDGCNRDATLSDLPPLVYPFSCSYYIHTVCNKPNLSIGIFILRLM
jgi:hypothetical protein